MWIPLDSIHRKNLYLKTSHSRSSSKWFFAIAQFAQMCSNFSRYVHVGHLAAIHKHDIIGEDHVYVPMCIAFFIQMVLSAWRFWGIRVLHSERKNFDSVRMREFQLIIWTVLGCGHFAIICCTHRYHYTSACFQPTQVPSGYGAKTFSGIDLHHQGLVFMFTKDLVDTSDFSFDWSTVKTGGEHDQWSTLTPWNLHFQLWPAILHLQLWAAILPTAHVTASFDTKPLQKFGTSFLAAEHWVQHIWFARNSGYGLSRD